jgi:cell division transport system permease protein
MKWFYLFREGFSGFKRAKLSMAAAIFTITISLLLLSSFSIFLFNAHTVVESLRSKVEMEVFLQDQLKPDEIDGLRARVGMVEGVKEVRFVSKEEAAAIFKEEFGEDIYKVLDFNPLPASLKISLHPDFRNVEGAERIFNAIRDIEGVEDVIYRKSLLELLDRRARVFLLIALGIGVFITISSIFLVANTIRLAIYAKRKIIQTMKLIGATRGFIRTPFLLEGLVQGFLGGLLAAGILFLTFESLGRWVSLELSDFVRVHVSLYGAVVAVGMVLGLIGSMISIRRFIGESVASPQN